MKILAVYNTCGISGNENFIYYTNAIQSFLAQEGVELHLVLSACQMSEFVKAEMWKNFGNRISYNLIHESLPLGITFNFSVQKGIEYYGEPEWILYIDSGINLWNYPDAVKRLVHCGECPPEKPAMIAARPSNDTGYEWWKIDPKPGEIFEIPRGSTCNLHLQLFSLEFYQAYGNRILPDIFANDTSESVFSFMCECLDRKFIINPDVHVFHNHSMDGASIGWQGPLLFRTTKSIGEIMREGAQYGMGYEEYNPKFAVKHDPAKWNPEKLYPWMKENLYLKESEFSYSSIKHKFVGGIK